MILSVLVSCKDAPVELQFDSEMFGSAALQVSGKTGSPIVSNISNPTLRLANFINDSSVTSIAIYNSPTCVEANRLGEISNTMGAVAPITLPADGQYDFYIKGLTSGSATSTAICMYSGLRYYLDRVMPTIGMSLAITTGTNSLINIDVSNCDNSTEGANYLYFSESSTLGLTTAWEPCLSSKPFTVSAGYGAKTIYGFAKDRAGNITAPPISVGYNYVAPVPTLSYNGSSVLYLGFVTYNSFTTTNGTLTSCSLISGALPSGLGLNTSPSCQVSGTPIVLMNSTNFTVRGTFADGQTADATFSFSVVNPLSINFNSLAGPGAGGGGAAHFTQLDVTVTSANVNVITKYRYKFGPAASVICGVHQAAPYDYSSAQSVSISIAKDFADIPDGTEVKLCVIGVNANNDNQNLNYAIEYAWMKMPLMRNLTEMANLGLEIVFDQVATNSTVTTLGYELGAAYTSISCAVVGGGICEFSFDATNYFSSMTGSFASTEKIFMRFPTASSVAAVRTATISLGGNVINVRTNTVSNTCGTFEKRVFLTKNKMFGNAAAASVSNPDQFCAQESSANELGGGWKALISTSSETPDEIIPAGIYCDVATDRQILSAGGIGSAPFFQSSFTKFVDGTLTNGGGSLDANYVINQSRTGQATQVWNGSSLSSNCSNWTTTTGSGLSSVLTHGSSSGAFTSSLLSPGVGSCAQERHVICFKDDLTP